MHLDRKGSTHNLLYSKGTLHEGQYTFWPVIRLPLEEFTLSFICETLHTFASYFAFFVSIGVYAKALYMKVNICFGPYLASLWWNFISSFVHYTFVRFAPLQRKKRRLFVIFSYLTRFKCGHLWWQDNVQTILDFSPRVLKHVVGFHRHSDHYACFQVLEIVVLCSFRLGSLHNPTGENSNQVKSGEI